MFLLNRTVGTVEQHFSSSTFYFCDYIYQFKQYRFKLRFKMSNNQIRKYNRYGCIPKLPEHKILLSTFNSSSFNQNKKQHYKKAKRGYLPVNIGTQVYAFDLLNDITISKSTLNKIEQLINTVIFTK